MFSKAAFYATALISSFKLAEARGRRKFAMVELGEENNSGGMVVMSQRERNGIAGEIYSQEFVEDLVGEEEYQMMARYSCFDPQNEIELVDLIAEVDGIHVGDGELEVIDDVLVEDLWGKSLAVIDANDNVVACGEIEDLGFFQYFWARQEIEELMEGFEDDSEEEDEEDEEDEDDDDDGSEEEDEEDEDDDEDDSDEDDEEDDSDEEDDEDSDQDDEDEDEDEDDESDMDEDDEDEDSDENDFSDEDDEEDEEDDFSVEDDEEDEEDDDFDEDEDEEEDDFDEEEDEEDED